MIALIISIILIVCAVATTIGWVAGSGAARNALEAETMERNAAQARERDRALGVIDALNAQRQLDLAACDMLHDYALEMDDQLLYASARLADVEEAIASMREYQVKPAVAVDVVVAPPQEVVYEVKTPKRPTRKKAAGSEATA